MVACNMGYTHENASARKFKAQLAIKANSRRHHSRFAIKRNALAAHAQ